MVGHDLQANALFVADVFGRAKGDFHIRLQRERRVFGRRGRNRLHLVFQFGGQGRHDIKGVHDARIGAHGSHFGHHTVRNVFDAEHLFGVFVDFGADILRGFRFRVGNQA